MTFGLTPVRMYCTLGMRRNINFRFEGHWQMMSTAATDASFLIGVVCTSISHLYLTI